MLCCLIIYLRSFIPDAERKKLDWFDTGNVSKGLSPMDTQMQRVNLVEKTKMTT